VTELTRAAFQRATGRTRAEIDRLLAAGLPHHTTGNGRAAEINIPVEKALAWMAGVMLDGSDASPNLAAARAHLAQAQEELTRLRLAKERGELVSAAEVQAADAIVFTALRDRIRGVTSCVPLLHQAALDGGELAMKPLLLAALDEALEQIGTAELVSVPAH
jgi:phage terminase Nu1 subunit (DNA packaging protein)